MEKEATYSTIDEYISQFSPEIQEKLKALRQVIIEAAPGAQEKFSYGMPAFTLHGNLVYFAAFKEHIGFFPTPSGITAFLDRLSEYKISKGTIQFPLNKPIPYELVKEIVVFRVAENTAKAQSKKKKK